MEKVINLLAGIETTTTEGANSIVLVSTGGSSTLEMSILDPSGAVLNTFKESLKMGFEFNAPNGFAGIRFKSGTDARIVYIVTRGNAKVNIIDGAQLKAQITNTAANPVPVMMTGEVEIVNDVGNTLPISGNVSILNFPQNQNVTVTNTPNVVIESGNVTAHIDNFPQNQNVTVTSGNITATINNSAPLNISGTVSIDQSAGALQVTTTQVVQGSQTQKRYDTNNNTVLFQPFNPQRKRWMIRNVSDWQIFLGIGTQDLQDDNAVIALAVGEYYVEDTPDIAAQEIYLRTLPDYTVGGFPNGDVALFSYQEVVI